MKTLLVAVAALLISTGVYFSPHKLPKKLGTLASPSGVTEATSSSGWTDDGSIVRLSTDGDNVGIGTRLPSSGFKVHIVGDTFGSGDLSLSGGDIILGSGTASTTLTSSAGRLGISTTTPAALLSVSGDTLLSGTTTVNTLVATSTVVIRGTIASSTAANGWNLTGGCYAINGVCVGAFSLTIGGSISGAANGGGLYVGSGNLQQTSAVSVGGSNASSTAMTAGPGGTTFSLIPLMTEIASTTLSAAGTTISLSNIPDRSILRIYFDGPAPSGSVSYAVRFNSDSAANYTLQRSTSNAAYTSSVSQTEVDLVGSGQTTAWSAMLEILNPPSRVKSFMWGTTENVTSAASGPGNSSGMGVWVNTTSRINAVSFNTLSANNFAVGTRIVVYGSTE